MHCTAQPNGLYKRVPTAIQIFDPYETVGAASYVVTGRGDRLSLCSAPHGAGRSHSRAAARRTFTRADLDARMAGIAWGRSDAFLDEHPDAYKDIDVVMRDAANLVRIDHTLRQIVNVKGD